MSKTWTATTGWVENPVPTVAKAPMMAAKLPAPTPAGLVKMGVFETKDGIFVVKPNKEKTRSYAKKLVEAPSPRLTEQGEVVDFDFQYAPGAIYSLTEADRMSVEKAKKLMIRYGRCIVCGRQLKVAESVERGIGPVCIKYFKGA